ncbi:PREDICTED: serine-rich adhesin for platelets-like [Trachymyrmex cornetzi]|uniref:serine-rich adhesin for platelets-like n=1 Tax=Trachymyrmex cornetzi TaxID=471704 RepID=UPI00084F572C|nr:PREDICTED: serine-rich adhesin for platelets-like [Trachymyrmex cornetzi]
MSTTDVVRIVQQGAAADEDQGRLKADLQYLRRRGLLKASGGGGGGGGGELSHQGRKCARCSTSFGRFYNIGTTCTRCRHRVCRQCRIEIRNRAGDKEVEWICNVCYKIAELHVVTGKWMHESSISSKSVSEKTAHIPVDILNRSIRRAWTINGPPTRWLAARKSPELRIYRSLPSRHQDYQDPLEDSSFDDRTLSKLENLREGSLNVKDCAEDASDNCRDAIEAIEKSTSINERTRREKPIVKEEEVPSFDIIRFNKKSEPSGKEQEDPVQEQSTPRISLIKPPRILAKFISPDTKPSPTKHGERKSNIPIFKRSSKEFEDIRSPQESPKRSLIPQRYRGSTDDLRRSREDITVPSLIPKLLSSRSKEERLKQQDSKDDIRPLSRSARKDFKEESKSPSLAISQTSTNKDEVYKSGIRIFRRENSREDVGKDSANSIKESAKGKQQEKQERTEVVGGAAKLKATDEPNRTRCEDGKDNANDAERSSSGREEAHASIESDSTVLDAQSDEKVDAKHQDARMIDMIIAENRTQDERMREQDTIVLDNEAIDEKHLLATREPIESIVENQEQDNNEKETRNVIEQLLDIGSDGDVIGITNERKGSLEIGYGKRPDEFQVVRRKFSKEEFSNPDDTDDTPNKRCSSHLSPEASPLSTRSSRYSPRESESEPTPALPRKTGGDSCSASQRIRDAITRTRRESNSSTRYESSGSESVRLSETGLHGYAELARKVKFFGGNGNGSVSSTIGGDEVVQRDSATSAGEDEINEDGYDRTGPVPSQGRTMLRRRRQFDAQGSRRRGRSHARSCCGGEDLQSLQTLNLIGRGGGSSRQRSPNPATGGPSQDQPASVVDYRRLVFISSDSSSGREEDDADSSCSSSSYLNGLPRNGSHHHHHAQSLEDCDWDYFESGSLPLPTTPIVTVGAGVNIAGTADIIGQDVWSCCPGRGSAACQACGGSRSANVLPVPVPIPVPVPYPVPVPAALWTGDFAAAASSMINRSDGHAEPGTLRLRGDPAAPWFAWHPRFNQPLHGARLDPRLAGAFDPTTCTFRPPDQVLTPRLYGPITETTTTATNLESSQISQDVRDEANVILKTEEFRKEENLLAKDINESSSSTTKNKKKLEETKNIEAEGKESEEETEMNEEATCEDSLLSSFERNAQGMYQHSREDSGSSSGRSSADSSDLEDDSSSHRFSKVFVVNDDSLTSDNDIEDNEENDSDSAAEGGVTLKRVTAIPEEEPVVLQHVRLLNEDILVENERGVNKNELEESKRHSKTYIFGNDQLKSDDISLDKSAANLIDKRKSRNKKIGSDNDDKRLPLLLQRRSIPEELYLADNSDCSDNRIELKSIRMLDPDSIDPPTVVLKDEKIQICSEAVNTSKEILQNGLIECPKSPSSDTWDSTIVPDSLEISGVSSETSVSGETDVDHRDRLRVFDNGQITRPIVTTNDCEKQGDKQRLSEADCSNVDIIADAFTDSCTSNESNTTGSEVSSDELHEYEVTPIESSFDYSNEIAAINDELLYQIGKKKTEDISKGIKENGYHLGNNHDDKTSPTMTKSGAKQSVQSERPISGRSSIKSMISAKDDNDDDEDDDDEGYRSVTCRRGGQDGGPGDNDPTAVAAGEERVQADIGDAILTSRIQEMMGSAEEQDGNGSKVDIAHDGPVRGEIAVQVGGNGDGNGVSGSGECSEEGDATRFRSVERRPCTRQENGFPADDQASAKDLARDSVQHNSNNNISGNNKYRSLVMITQEASYQPVSVVTSDTTTLLQPDEIHSAGSQGGLAGYFQLALEAASEPQLHRKNAPRKPLMVKRLPAAVAVSAVTTSHQSAEPEVDSGLSVGSASESDDVSVKNVPKPLNCRQENADDVSKDRSVSDYRELRVSSQSSDDNSGGVIILEEGLADDDSWVEEVSHDEDEPGATTATEESSEDEANNFGDREEELRGYRRQAIDFTLHTIVEESCEESETEPSLAAGSPSKKPRPPSASDLEKYFFFGLGGDGNSSSIGSREVDSLSETSSIYSEGLESLGQDETNGSGQNQDRSNNSDGFLNSSRLEKYYLSEFLGFDQDRRDSDGSVGSDSEGRPSPEAQRRKKLVRARGTGRSHSSSLDNLLALTQSSQNLSSQNSLQDLSLNQDVQETQSEGSSTETDGTEDGQTAVFGTDGQFDTVKRKKKKPRNLGTQSPRVSDDRNKTPEPSREMTLMNEVVMENENEENSEDSDRAKTPQPESVLSSSSSPSTLTNNSNTLNATSSSQMDSRNSVSVNSIDGQRSKQQSRDSGFVGSCDDLLQHQKLPDESQTGGIGGDGTEIDQEADKDRSLSKITEHPQNANQNAIKEGATGKSNLKHPVNHASLPHLANASLSRKDSFNNWSSDEETNLMMSKMRQFFKTMVANTNGQGQNATSANSGGVSPAPSPRLPGYTSKARLCVQNRTKPPQLVYFENELTRLMKTVPGIRDEQVREIVEYLSSEDTWSDSYDSSDYTSSDLEGAAGGRRSALQEQISQSCQQIISKFDTTSTSGDAALSDKEKEQMKGSGSGSAMQPAPCLGRDTAFVYQKLVQSFTKMAGDGVSSDANSTPHSSPPLIAKVMHHIGSRLVALMHEVSEGGPAAHHPSTWRRYSQHHRTPSSASTTEDDDSTSDSTNAPSSAHLLPRSKSHDPLLLINSHPAVITGQEGEEREASDYERFSWRGSFESTLMAADSRTKLSLLACSGDVSSGGSVSASASALAAKRRSAGDLLFNPKSFSREQLDRVRSCGSIGGGSGAGTGGAGSGSVEERIWSNRRRSSVPDANTRGESGASAGDEDTEDELEYGGESRATTLPRGMQSAISAATNSLPRLSVPSAPTGLTTTSSSSSSSSSSATAAVTSTSSSMHKAHSVYHFLPQHSGVKSARYRPPGFARNSNIGSGGIGSGPKRAVSAPGLQVSGSQSTISKRDNSRSRRQQAMSLTSDDGSSLSEACSTPIIGAGSRAGSSHTVLDMDDIDPGHLATRSSLSSLGARSDSMASVYSGAGEGRCCRSVVVTGEVEFALQYDYKNLTFEVHVTKCKNLAPVDVKRKRSDPYVKVYLLPDKSKSGKRKTKVKKHTLNPEFNETLKFHMSLSGLETRTLWLTVWHSDMFGRNDFLGEVRMPLENKIFDDPTPHWYPLQERTEPFDDPVAYKGEVIVGLKFVPPDPAQQERDRESSAERGSSKTKKNWSRGALHVLVKEARNLQTRGKNSGTCDPFCKSYLLPDKGRSGKQKTGVVRRSGGSPVWGHTFIYKDVSLQELAERGLELTVWDHDRIASNEFLGGVRFNLGTGKHYGKSVDWMDATGRELSLWQNMLERPNFWVEGAVTLRPNLHNHGKNNGT